MGKFERERWSANGVIVTVYEESSMVGSQHSQNPKIKPRNWRPRRSSCGGYDRRAELLAHTHHLRNAGPQQDSTATNPVPKSKKRRRLSAPLRKLGRSFGQLFGGRKGHGGMRRSRPKKMKGDVVRGGTHGVKCPRG